MSKRELLARSLYWSGASFVLNQLPARDLLLVLNYHRVGNPDEDLFDPALFSATAEELDAQISFLKRHVDFVSLEEAVAFVEGGASSQSGAVKALVTFDDGYRDNYQAAFPVLRSHGVQGVFFIPTSMVGSSHVPWWDHIAYLLRTARQRRFSLRYPAAHTVDMDQEGFARSLEKILTLYKRPENTDPGRFFADLREGAKGDEPPGTQRRFFDWDEAREMINGGMAIGSHTHSHTVLSQLDAERQREELVQSRALIQQHLGIAADSLSYPVGHTTSFSEKTKELAREAGYRVAFSFYDGTNFRGKTPAYDVKRVCVGGQSWERFQVQAAVCRTTGRYWP